MRGCGPPVVRSRPLRRATVAALFGSVAAGWRPAVAVACSGLEAAASLKAGGRLVLGG